jgi:hypothetical protein
MTSNNTRRMALVLAAIAWIGATPLLAQDNPRFRPAKLPDNIKVVQRSAPIVAEPKTFDFGTARPDDIIEASFTLRNTGDTPVRVLEVRPTCKCTIPTLEKDIIGPGESIKIDALLDVRGSLGRVHKKFTVVFADYSATMELAIAGKMNYPIRIKPERPPLPALIAGKRMGDLELRATDGRPFRILAINGQKPQVLEQRPAGGETAVHWRVRYEASGTVEGMGEDAPYFLVIETDHPTAGKMAARLWGAELSKQELEYFKVWNDIFAHRNYAYFGEIEPGGFVEIDAPIMRPKSDMSVPADVSMICPGLDMEVVAVERMDEEHDERYIVRLKNVSDVDRVVITPLYFEDNGIKTRMWIGGRLRGSSTN